MRWETLADFRGGDSRDRATEIGHEELMLLQTGVHPNCLPGQSPRVQGGLSTTPHAAVKDRPGSLQFLFFGGGAAGRGVRRSTVCSPDR